MVSPWSSFPPLRRCSSGVREEPPDAVITDLMMPDVDGIELTRQLRATDPHLPIFVLTASTEVGSAIAALKAGATEYLFKPVNVDELLTQLRRALDERPMREEAATLERTRKAKFSAGAILGDEPAIEDGARVRATRRRDPPFDGAAARRERNGQESRRAHAALHERAGEGAFCRDQLLGASGALVGG